MCNRYITNAESGETFLPIRTPHPIVSTNIKGAITTFFHLFPFSECAECIHTLAAGSRIKVGIRKTFPQYIKSTSIIYWKYIQSELDLLCLTSPFPFRKIDLARRCTAAFIGTAADGGAHLHSDRPVCGLRLIPFRRHTRVRAPSSVYH